MLIKQLIFFKQHVSQGGCHEYQLKIMITLVLYATARAVRVSRVSAFAAVA